jgi:hypothetical protein
VVVAVAAPIIAGEVNADAESADAETADLTNKEVVVAFGASRFVVDAVPVTAGLLGH